MTEKRTGLRIPGPALVLVTLAAVVFLLALVDIEAVPRGVTAASTSLKIMGILVLVLGAGGLVSVAVERPQAWTVDAMRWSLVALGGATMVAPGWGTALAFGAAVFGLVWTRTEEGRY